MKNIWISIICILFLVACSTDQGGKLNTNFRTGSEGISLTFLDTNQEIKTYENDIIELGINIENKGATDINNLELKVSGYDTDYFNVWSEDEINSLFGKSLYTENGEFSRLYYYIKNIKLPATAEKYTANMAFKACYNYQTIANPQICIVKETGLNVGEDVCEITPIVLSNQGAPVAVTKVEQTLVEKNLMLKIYLSHVGNGKIIGCDSKTGKVRIEEIAFSGYSTQYDGIKKINCPETEFGLPRKDPIICTAVMPDTIESSKPVLNIRLSYPYTNEITKKIIVERLK